jgi:predicted transcriptional regulator
MSKSDYDNLGLLVNLIFGLALRRRGRKKGVLDHFTRGKVYGCIISEPGIHFNLLRKTVSLSSSSLAHHIRVLKDSSLIIEFKDGMYKRFFPISEKLPVRIGDLNMIQRKIYRIIRENEGISQSDIAKRLDTRRQVINYHLGHMRDSGYIHVKIRGNRSECRINPKKASGVQDDRQYERRARKEIRSGWKRT